MRQRRGGSGGLSAVAGTTPPNSKSVETDSNGKPLERAAGAGGGNANLNVASLSHFFAGGAGASRTPTDAVTVLTGAKANAVSSIDLACIYGGAATRTYEVSTPAPPLLTWLDLLLCAFAGVFQVAHWGLSRATTFNVSAAVVRHFPAWLQGLSGLVSPQLSPVAFVLIVLIVGRIVRSWAGTLPVESVTAIRGVGLQIVSRPGRQWGSASGSTGIAAGTVQRVLDVNSIDALVIHEGYFRHRCVYFLAAVVRDEPESVVLFADTLPRLEALRAVLRGLRHVLYGTPEYGPTLGQADPDGKGDGAHSLAGSVGALDVDEVPARSPTTRL